MKNEISSSVGIVGGGKGGLEILKTLSRNDILTISFVVDLDPSAPALVYAFGKKIPTYTDIRKALEESPADYIVEATGSEKVLQILRSLTREGVEIVSSKAALLFFTVIEETREMENKSICEDIAHILEEIDTSMQSVQKSLVSINRVSIDLDMLALNARIEAAHAGAMGKGFSVVADEVKLSSKTVQELADEIYQLNENISSIAGGIRISLAKLQ